MALKLLLVFFWLLALPLVLGGGSLLEGFLFLFCLMEILSLPMIFAKASLHLLVWSYGLLLLAFGGIRLWKRRKQKLWGMISPRRILARGWEHKILLLAMGLILVQMTFAGLYGHLDADDSFYVAAAATDAYTDTIYAYNPYTGLAYEALPSRYTLSPFPVFAAVMSRLCGGLHPAILAHMLLPPLFLLLVYEAAWHLGGLLFGEEGEGRCWYLFFLALLLQVSSWTIYNPGNFTMIRLWQGKAVLGGILLPCLTWLGLSLALGREAGGKTWRRYFLCCMSCGFVSSMGIVLGPACAGLLALLALVFGRGWKRAGLMLCPLIPCLIQGLLYVLLW